MGLYTALLTVTVRSPMDISDFQSKNVTKLRHVRFHLSPSKLREVPTIYRLVRSAAEQGSLSIIYINFDHRTTGVASQGKISGRCHFAVTLLPGTMNFIHPTKYPIAVSHWDCHDGQNAWSSITSCAQMIVRRYCKFVVCQKGKKLGCGRKIDFCKPRENLGSCKSFLVARMVSGLGRACLAIAKYRTDSVWRNVEAIRAWHAFLD